MKRMIALAALFLCSSQLMAQNTYYWVGAGTSTAWTTGSNWNRTLGGGGLSRSTPSINDTLIFDGSNMGAGFTGQITVTNVPYQTVAALIFRNNADVRFTGSPGTAIPAGTTAAGVQVGTSGSFTGQTVAGTGTSFTTFFAIGDFVSTGTANTGTGGVNSIGQITAITSDVSLTQSNGTLAMIASNGTSVFFMKDVMVRISNLLSVDASSKFEMASSAPLIFKVNPGGVGTVNGTISVTSNFQKLVADGDGTAFITFNAGAKFQFTGTQSTAPFDAVANPTNNNIIFKAGSIYENNSTTSASTNAAGSVFGAVIPKSVIDFQKGSSFVNNSTQVSSILGNANRAYPNVVLNGATSGWQPTSPVDTFTINAATTWTNASNSYFPIKGDLIFNGTLASGTASPVFVFCGSVPQNITATGTVASSGFARIVIGSGSSVKLTTNFTQNIATSLSTNGSYIRNFGSLDLGNFVVSNAIENQSGALQGYSTATTTGSQTGATVSAASPYTITVTSATGFSQGMLITGTGIPANTTIVLVSGTTITVSNPIPAGTYDIASAVRTGGSQFITANTGGLAANFPVQTGSTYSFPSAPGANYTFNAATTTPFPSSVSNIQANNFTLGAAVSSNLLNLTINGTLNLANNMFTVPVSDTVRIVSGNAVVGFSATSYISLDVNRTTGTRGLLRIGNINAVTTFPIGNSGYYLPVTITPAGTGEDYSVNTFSGVTVDATPNGTAFTSGQKANIVDAVWNIANNFTPTGNPTIQLGWPATLEGSNFASFANNTIGLAPYTTSWGVAAGTGNNTTNIASNAVSTFGAFAVGKVGANLPVKFGTVTVAQTANKQVKIAWEAITEINMNKYVVEVSKDGASFTEAGAVIALGFNSYSFIHTTPVDGINYYRIKAVEKSGSITYSKTVSINLAKLSNMVMSIYPNPVQNHNIAVSINQPSTNLLVQVLAVDGRIVYQASLTHAGGVVKYNLPVPAQLQNGIYMVKLTGNNTILATQQIILE